MMRHISAGFSLKTMAACLLLSAGVGISHRRLLSQQGASVNIWDHIIPHVADPFTYTFGILPLLLIHCVRNAPTLSQEIRLIRSGSRVRWLSRVFGGRLSFISMVYASWLAGALATGWGLPLTRSWSAFAAGSTATHLCQKYFAQPILALAAQLTALVLISAFFATIPALVASARNSMAVMLSATALVFLWVAGGLRGIPPAVNAWTYLHPQRLASVTGSPGWALIVTPLPVVGLFAGVVFWERGGPRALAGRWPLVAYIATSTAAVVLAAGSSHGSPLETALTVFSGAHVRSLLLIVLLHGGLAYVFGLWFDDQPGGRLRILMLRYRSFSVWLWHSLLPWAWLAAAMAIAGPACALLVAALRGAGAGSGETISLSLLAFHLIVNGTAQIALFLLVMVIARIHLGADQGTLLGLLAVASLMFIAYVSQSPRIPGLMHTTAHAVSSWTDVLLISAELMGLLALCLGAIRASFQWPVLRERWV